MDIGVPLATSKTVCMLSTPFMIQSQNSVCLTEKEGLLIISQLMLCKLILIVTVCNRLGWHLWFHLNSTLTQISIHFWLHPDASEVNYQTKNPVHFPFCFQFKYDFPRSKKVFKNAQQGSGLADIFLGILVKPVTIINGRTTLYPT